MSGKQSTEKNSEGGFSFSSLSSILSIIGAAFNLYKTPATTLPPPLILTGGNLRSGMSARDLGARIISRRSEAGLPSGDIFPDGPNTDEVMAKIITEEIISMILTEAVVQVAIQPGQLVTGSGVGNLGAPIAVQGSVTTIGTGKGIIS